jgi:hypothetical protein
MNKRKKICELAAEKHIKTNGRNITEDKSKEEWRMSIGTYQLIS